MGAVIGFIGLAYPAGAEGHLTLDDLADRKDHPSVVAIAEQQVHVLEVLNLDFGFLRTAGARHANKKHRAMLPD